MGISRRWQTFVKIDRIVREYKGEYELARNSILILRRGVRLGRFFQAT
jgi:hypothetical protein